MPGPFLSNITATFFVNLINRLGVRPPPPDGFDLINTVQPVSIVDSDITLSAVTTTLLLDTPFTEGILTGPASGTLMADTGAQAVGNYFVLVVVGGDGSTTVPGSVVLARRNAANNADVWAQVITWGSALYITPTFKFPGRIVLLAGERLIVRVGATSMGVAQTAQASIWITPS
jgi:hypothetical protein